MTTVWISLLIETAAALALASTATYWARTRLPGKVTRPDREEPPAY